MNSNLVGNDRTQVLNIKNISFTFPDLLKNRNVVQRPTEPMIWSSPFHLAKAPITPSVKPVSPTEVATSSRGRLPSFNLNDDLVETSPTYKQKVLEEMLTWTEDINNIE